MSLSSLPTGDERIDAMNASALQHDELLENNKVKIRILIAYLRENLEGIGRGNVSIGTYFPDEVMFEDLQNLGDNQVVEIHQIGDKYFQIICQELGIK